MVGTDRNLDEGSPFELPDVKGALAHMEGAVAASDNATTEQEALAGLMAGSDEAEAWQLPAGKVTPTEEDADHVELVIQEVYEADTGSRLVLRQIGYLLFLGCCVSYLLGPALIGEGWVVGFALASAVMMASSMFIRFLRLAEPEGVEPL